MPRGARCPMNGTVYAAYPPSKAKPLESERQPRVLRRGLSLATMLGNNGYDYLGIGPKASWPGEVE